MPKEVTFAVEEDLESGGYCARALGYGIFTQAEDWPELREMVLDAVECHFDPEERPQQVNIHFVWDEVIAA